MVTVRCARPTVTVPSSSGCRIASRTSRRNSGNSSRNKTPWCASVTSPGRMSVPPPSRLAAELVWCGARRVLCVPLLSDSPAVACTCRTASRSLADSGGRMPGKRRSIALLPVPGGPVNSRLWPPAAATVSASFGVVWPRRSPRSGSRGTVTSDRAGVGGDGRLHLGVGEVDHVVVFDKVNFTFYSGRI